MKFHFCIILVLVFVKTTNAQLPVSADSLFNYIQSNSVYTAANWSEIQIEFKQKLSFASNDIDSIQALVSVFEQLNDVHSSITYNYKQYGYYRGLEDSVYKRIQPILQLAQQQNNIPKTALINGSYLYVLVPGYQAWGQQVQMYAQALYDSICKYTQYPIQGCIVDLRLNLGGQASVMLAGLSAILGDANLGGGILENGEMVFPFSIKSGDFYIGDNVMADVSAKCLNTFDTLPVAVLIGPITSSSGSITAIAFKGRPKTYFIGEPTAAGYTTGNNYIAFGENLTMELATNFSGDRNGVVYKENVLPDITFIGNDNFENATLDRKMNYALFWLMSFK